MGISPFSSCFTNAAINSAPNPSPGRWTMLRKQEFEGGYVLKVKYLDATNFEGIKIMVYKGKYVEREYLDPHFSPGGDSPLARFKPTPEGWTMAIKIAGSL